MALIKLNNQSLSAVTSAGLPSGTVLQVKEGSTTTEVAHTSAWADTNLSVSITPTSSSSKILVMINQHCYKNSGNCGGGLRIMRDSTVAFEDSQTYQAYGSETSARFFHNMQYIDSPSTTNAITYKTQGKEHAGDFRTQQGGHFESRIIVMEIAG